MKILGGWTWKQKHLAQEERRKRQSTKKLFKLRPLNGYDYGHFIKHDTVLITGDGWCLPEDVERFETLKIPHDLYCINKSLEFFKRPVTHWGAVDPEESMWFTETVNEQIMPEDHHIVRHTVGHMPMAFDVHWYMTDEQYYENEAQRQLWLGNSGYFGILTAVAMGYKKIILAGMPLDALGHWYEGPEVPPPQWVPRCYTQWMDYKIQVPDAEKVRSMSGYTAFIFGDVTEEWLRKG